MDVDETTFLNSTFIYFMYFKHIAYESLYLLANTTIFADLFHNEVIR